MSLWLSDRPLILASQSASRRAILEAVGLPLEVLPADIDERGIEARSAARQPGEIAVLLATEKARAVARQHPDALVLGADQTLALGDRRFSKPKNRAGAREQLSMLRGKTHALHSGIALVRGDVVVFAHCEPAHLTMRAFSDAFLDAYLDAAGPAVTSSVGGYQVEGAGIQLFERIAGDHFTILGLPILPLLAFLRREGLLCG